MSDVSLPHSIWEENLAKGRRKLDNSWLGFSTDPGITEVGQYLYKLQVTLSSQEKKPKSSRQKSPKLMGRWNFTVPISPLTQRGQHVAHL